MTEKETFHQYIPQIAELLMYLQEMDVLEYQDWKVKTLAGTPEKARHSMYKILFVVDSIINRSREYVAH